MAIRAPLLAAVAVVCVGCASGPAGTVRDSPNVLTGDVLRDTGTTTVWDALMRLRPYWLRSRGSTSILAPGGDRPIVYLHGIQHGPVESLQRMNIDQVRRVEFLDGRDATTRFGVGHGAGAIMVDMDRS